MIDLHFDSQEMDIRPYSRNQPCTDGDFTNVASACCLAGSFIPGIPAMKRAYSINEFCNVYELGRTKAYEEIKSGRLKAVKVGSRTIIRADDAEQWLAALQGIES